MTTYTNPNFYTKSALKRAIIAGAVITCNDQTPRGIHPINQGSVTLSGPHYPSPHTWYAEGIVKDGVLVWIDGITVADRAMGNKKRHTHGREYGRQLALTFAADSARSRTRPR